MEVFKEEQNFIKSWWVLMVIIFLLSAIPMFMNTNNYRAATGFIYPFIILFSVVVLFYFLTLQTRIDEKTIAVKFGFFHRHFKEFKWENIKAVEIKKYNPIWEYGGWGYRGWSKRKRAFSVSGNMGLQITFIDNSMILIGTKDAEKMKTYLLHLKQKYQIAALSEMN